MRVLLRYESDSGRAIAEAKIDLSIVPESLELDQVRRQLDRASDQLIQLIAKHRQNEPPDRNTRPETLVVREHHF